MYRMMDCVAYKVYISVFSGGLFLVSKRDRDQRLLYCQQKNDAQQVNTSNLILLMFFG